MLAVAASRSTQSTLPIGGGNRQITISAHGGSGRWKYRQIGVGQGANGNDTRERVVERSQLRHKHKSTAINQKEDDAT